MHNRINGLIFEYHPIKQPNVEHLIVTVAAVVVDVVSDMIIWRPDPSFKPNKFAMALRCFFHAIDCVCISLSCNLNFVLAKILNRERKKYCLQTGTHTHSRDKYCSNEVQVFKEHYSRNIRVICTINEIFEIKIQQQKWLSKIGVSTFYAGDIVVAH